MLMVVISGITSLVIQMLSNIRHSVITAPKSGSWDQVGGLTVETFHCCTKHLGTSMFNLKEHQVWLKDIPPIDSLLICSLVK